MITRFRYDTTQTFSFSGGGVGADAPCTTLLYFPLTPIPDMSIRDEIERWEATTVTETLEVLLKGTSAEVISAVNTIEDILIKAQRQVNSIVDSGTYIEYQANSNTTVYRSRILDGRVEWSSEPALRKLPATGDTSVKVYIFITRVGYWEDSETELPLSNTSASGVAATGGRTIYNYDGTTTGHDNWVKIDSASIVGRIPAPIKVKLTNTTGSVQSYKHLHIGVNALADSSMSHQIEGESAYVLSDGSSVASGSASNGNLWRVTNVDTTTRRISFTFNAALMQKTQGRYFRIFGRFLASGSGVYAKITLRSGSDTGALLAEGNEVLLSGSYDIKDLGTLPLPAGGYNPASEDIWFVIELRAATTQTVDLDFLQLYPTESYRYITQSGETLSANDMIYDNQIDYPNQIYAEDATLNRRRMLYAAMGRTYVYPNRDNRIYVLYDGASVVHTNTFSIRAWYRPRVISI